MGKKSKNNFNINFTNGQCSKIIFGERLGFALHYTKFKAEVNE
jgi:hypothetical protein